MSQYGYCPRGGTDGIQTNHHEMLELSEMMNSKFSDEYIPLPEMDMTTQINILKEIDEDTDYENVIYWESDTGEHGWCKKNTGKVIQWG